MNRHDVAVATMTWARSEDEGDLLIRSLTRLSGYGWPIAVANRADRPAFHERLRQIRGVQIATPSTAGLVPQMQASVGLALSAGTSFILYTEPDKEDFFGPGLQSLIERAPTAADVGIVLAARTDRSLESYPAMQRYTEGVINHLCAGATGRAGDFSYGPFLMSRSVAAHVATVPSHVGWGWRPSTFLAAHQHGLRLVHVLIDAPCPPGQRDENDGERRHRLRQLAENVLGLVS